MKYTLLFIVLIFQISCSDNAPHGNQYPIDGYIDILNGEGKPTKTKYTLQVWDSTKFKEKVTFEEFIRLSSIISEESKYKCKYKLTYEPIQISMFYNLNGKYDTLFSIMTFSAKNSFGVKDEIREYFKIVGGKIVE